MERRLSKKIQTHCDNLKDDILKWMEENNLELTHNESGVKFMDKFEIFMANYENITFTKEDFLKRKRIKNMAPQQDRCTAKRADGSQCTRRKKQGEHFCGTHIKGTPHGEITAAGEALPTKKKIEVWTEDIKGIHTYIDADGNVYNTVHVMQNRENPEIVGRWEKIDGKYVIKDSVS